MVKTDVATQCSSPLINVILALDLTGVLAGDEDHARFVKINYRPVQELQEKAAPQKLACNTRPDGVNRGYVVLEERWIWPGSRSSGKAFSWGPA